VSWMRWDRDGVYKLASRGGMALTLLHQFSSLGFRNESSGYPCAVCRKFQRKTSMLCSFEIAQ
jgi:hypothetical protein